MQIKQFLREDFGRQRSLDSLYTFLALREPITRGIAAPHDQMPQFAVSDEQVDMIVAYIKSLSTGR